MSFIAPDHLTASGSMIGGNKYMSRLMRDVWIEMTIEPAILGKPLLVTHPQGVWIEDDKMIRPRISSGGSFYGRPL